MTIGFRRWKDALDRLEKHEKSACHVASKKAFHNRERKSVSVVSQISKQRVGHIVENRLALKQIMETILHLAYQGLPMRSHVESEGSKNRGMYCTKHSNATIYNCKIWFCMYLLIFKETS